MTRSTPVRPLFRALAWVLGPLLVGAGVLLIVLDLIGRKARGWPVWSHSIHLGFWLGVGNLIIGLLILRTARTGRDPYTVPSADASSGADEMDG